MRFRLRSADSLDDDDAELSLDVSDSELESELESLDDSDSDSDSSELSSDSDSDSESSSDSSSEPEPEKKQPTFYDLASSMMAEAGVFRVGPDEYKNQRARIRGKLFAVRWGQSSYGKPELQAHHEAFDDHEIDGLGWVKAYYCWRDDSKEWHHSFFDGSMWCDTEFSTGFKFDKLRGDVAEMPAKSCCRCSKKC